MTNWQVAGWSIGILICAAILSGGIGALWAAIIPPLT
jgi:hypothetical protein